MKKAIQKLQKVYPKLTVRGIFYCPFLLFNLFTLRQGVFFLCQFAMWNCLFTKKFLKESRVLFMGLAGCYNIG